MKPTIISGGLNLPNLLFHYLILIVTLIFQIIIKSVNPNLFLFLNKAFLENAAV